MNKYKIAIAGAGGMVGGALARYFKDAILYDPPKEMGNKEELNKADIIFICVPTPYNNGFDLSIVESAVKDLEDSKIIVIKSTVLPGTTQKLQAQYPQHRFLFNPEFLTEATADQDMRYPDRQIVGYTKESFTITGEIMGILPLAPYERIMPSGEAEMTKYMNNTWFATKVIWANQMYDLCQKIGVDYEITKEAMAQDKRIGRSHLEIWHKGYRGYGTAPISKCLDKDICALINFAADNNINLSLLKEVDNINKDLWGKYGIKKM